MACSILPGSTSEARLQYSKVLFPGCHVCKGNIVVQVSENFEGLTPAFFRVSQRRYLWALPLFPKLDHGGSRAVDLGQQPRPCCWQIPLSGHGALDTETSMWPGRHQVARDAERSPSPGVPVCDRERGSLRQGTLVVRIERKSSHNTRPCLKAKPEPLLERGGDVHRETGIFDLPSVTFLKLSSASFRVLRPRHRYEDADQREQQVPGSYQDQLSERQRVLSMLQLLKLHGYRQGGRFKKPSDQYLTKLCEGKRPIWS